MLKDAAGRSGRRRSPRPNSGGSLWRFNPWVKSTSFDDKCRDSSFSGQRGKTKYLELYQIQKELPSGIYLGIGNEAFYAGQGQPPLAKCLWRMGILDFLSLTTLQLLFSVMRKCNAGGAFQILRIHKIRYWIKRVRLWARWKNFPDRYHVGFWGYISKKCFRPRSTRFMLFVFFFSI